MIADDDPPADYELTILRMLDRGFTVSGAAGNQAVEVLRRRGLINESAEVTFRGKEVLRLLRLDG